MATVTAPSDEAAAAAERPARAPMSERARASSDSAGAWSLRRWW